MTLFSHNGQLQALPPTALSPLYSGVAHGLGLFETLRFRHQKPCFFKEHLQRLLTSAKALGWRTLPLSEIQWWEETCALLQESGVHEGIVKWLVMEQDGVLERFVCLRDLSPRPAFQAEQSLCAARHPRASGAFTSQHKTLSYLDNLLEKRAAKEEGFDEAFFVNEKGCLTEGTMSNLFFVADNKIYTPALNNGLLPGIVRAQTLFLLKTWGVEVIEGHFHPRQLHKADEVFFTNSNILVAGVGRVVFGGEETNYQSGFAPRLFKALVQREEELLQQHP